MQEAAHLVDYPIAPTPFTDVRFVDRVWAPRIQTNRLTTIPYAFRKCEETGRIANFEKAASILAGEQVDDRSTSTAPFDDSDVFKIIEGAAYALSAQPDPKLEAHVDAVIAKIAGAQEPDGYLYTNRTIRPEDPHEWAGRNRWEKTGELSHELYNVGHMYEAATAYFTATGKRTLLDVAIRNADLIDREFGPGKITTAPGHQEIEIGLVKLYRATGDGRYLRLAKFFLDTRGPGGDLYGQNHRKVVEQDAAVGHAVRAAYMYAGMADVAALTGDPLYLNAINRIWEDVVSKKLYLTGGIGARRHGEAFGEAYELPNMSAYCETCAAIANVFWNHRLFLLHGHSKYIDVLERSLYNNVLSGISMSGTEFFYPNPLQSIGQHQRSPWFDCSCCPSNLTRFIASVPGYAFARQADTVFVNLFTRGHADFALSDAPIRLTTETDYPWDGRIRISVESTTPRRFTLAVRIPGWAMGKPVPSDLYRYAPHHEATPVRGTVNSDAVMIDEASLQNGYWRIERTWQSGDTATLELPMPSRRVLSHENIESNRAKVALERGPLVYCVEGCDQSDPHALSLCLENDASLEQLSWDNLLPGAVAITAPALLLRRQDGEQSIARESCTVTAIPYHLWAHRGPGDMTVWIPSDCAHGEPIPLPSIASASTVSASRNVNTTAALYGEKEPADSSDRSLPYVHWWPHSGTTEWIEYRFAARTAVSCTRVYWFDDERHGGACRTPISWRLLYRNRDTWQPVDARSPYLVDKNRFIDVSFDEIRTEALRLEIQLQQDASAGVLRWHVCQ